VLYKILYSFPTGCEIDDAIGYEPPQKKRSKYMVPASFLHCTCSLNTTWCVGNGVIVGLGVGSCCIADKGTSSHNAIHGSDGFAFCICTLKMTDMLQNSRVKNRTVTTDMQCNARWLAGYDIISLSLSTCTTGSSVNFPGIKFYESMNFTQNITLQKYMMWLVDYIINSICSGTIS